MTARSALPIFARIGGRQKMLVMVSAIGMRIAERIRPFGGRRGVGQKMLMIMGLLYRRIHRIDAGILRIGRRQELLLCVQARDLRAT